MKESHLVHWLFFNRMIVNVELSIEQLESIFANLTKDELVTWIEEVKCCYSGTIYEKEANEIHSYLDLASFYHNHPITE